MTDTLRAEIISEIMKLVRPARVPLAPRPSIADLEKMINAEQDIRLEPDGSVSVPDQRPRTVGDVADAVLRILEKHRPAPGIVAEGQDAQRLGAKPEEPGPQSGGAQPSPPHDP